MTGITLVQARTIVDSGLAAPRSGPERRIAIAICDAGGHPVALMREDGAAPLLAHIAQAKAQTCIAYGKATKMLMDLSGDYGTWFEGISKVSQSRMGLPLIATKGGVFARTADGAVCGAVGVAGEAGEFDEAICIAGIEAAGLIPDAG